ncbi:Proteasome subunit alpha type-2 [Cichlidogyrus casuarinus]|uniref:Proteasome subunit alpha type n=1 Tax=Cichlidogyrus casuarinus TaxID=1844966 RepID=A0ABD2QG30_9PLAT
MSERFSFSLTTFSSSGKLAQIEYALKAVEAGAPSVGIRAVNGAVLAVEKKFSSDLIDENTFQRIEKITNKIGMVYSGLSPDYRLLVKQARKLAVSYKMTYGEDISPEQLVQRVAAVMQEYTQSGGVRPFGVSLLIAGWNDDLKRAFLYQCDPSGTYFSWKATALGKNSANGKTFLEKRYSDKVELEDAVHAAILTLKESFEGQIKDNNIEVALCNENGFKILSTSEIKDYLAMIP